MKSVLVALSIGVATLFVAEADHHKGKDGKSQFKTQMVKMNRAWRDVRSEIKDQESIPEALRVAANMKSEVLIAKRHTPDLANAMEDEEKAACIQEFQKATDDILALVQTLEQALARRNWHIADSTASKVHRAHKDVQMKFNPKEKKKKKTKTADS